MEILSTLTLIILAAFAGVCIATWLMLRFYTHKLENRISDFLQHETSREQEMRNREKLVVAAAFEGELLANRDKIQAFMLVYQEMLRSLREPGRAPKYKQGGEIIHDRPTLARTIFDAYADRLELLGPDIAGDLSLIYAQVETDPAYKTLSNELSADQATHIVERIIEQAKGLIAPIEKTIAALRIIVRSKQSFR